MQPVAKTQVQLVSVDFPWSRHLPSPSIVAEEISEGQSDLTEVYHLSSTAHVALWSCRLPTTASKWSSLVVFWFGQLLLEFQAPYIHIDTSIYIYIYISIHIKTHIHWKLVGTKNCSALVFIGPWFFVILQPWDSCHGASTDAGSGRWSCLAGWVPIKIEVDDRRCWLSA